MNPAAKELKDNNRKIAKDIKDLQRNAPKRRGSSKLTTIMKVRQLRNAGLTHKEIAKESGLTKSTVTNICHYINKVELKSPEMKEKAVIAAKEILASQDNTNRVKIIEKVFHEESKAPTNSVNVNLNIDPGKLNFDNNDYDFVDMDNH